MQVVANVENATAANGANKVWECYVARISPTNATQVLSTVIKMRSRDSYQSMQMRSTHWRKLSKPETISISMRM